MKNVIFIVVDSVFYDKICSNNYRNTPAPFLNSLKSKGIWSTNMYSEAALVSLLCGNDTLKYGGYLKKLSNKKTIMSVFKENNYDVFFNSFQPLVYPKYSYPGVTEYYYNVCYDFNAVWEYRLNYYSNLKKQSLYKKEYDTLLIEMLEDNLFTWKKFFEDIIKKEKNTQLIYDLINKDGIEEELKKLNLEIVSFKKNKLNYLYRLLDLGKNHELFKIKTYKLDNYDFEFKKKVYSKYNKLIKRVYWKNFWLNLRNNRIVLKDFFSDRQKFVKLLKVYKNTIFDKDLMFKIDYKTKSLKASPSINTNFEHFINWLNLRKSSKPYFAYLHTEECHYPEIFYSHDTKNMDLLDEEFKAIKEYVSSIPKNYKGSIAYDLSILYTDLSIKRLYYNLEKNNELDNTIIAITADHSSSYSMDPYHENYVRNYYRENYNIPFILIGKDIKPECKNGFYNSKDIPATIIDICGLNIPEMYDGKSILKFNGRHYVLLENVNGGCPDYYYRDFMLGVRNKKYSVVAKATIDSDPNKLELIAVFDVKKDKDERNNLINKTNFRELVKQEENYIKQELINLQKNIKKHNFINE